MKILIYSVKLVGNKLVSVRTQSGELLTIPSMLDHIKVDGFEYYAIIDGKEVDFVFDFENGKFVSPSITQLKKMEQIQ